MLESGNGNKKMILSRNDFQHILLPISTPSGGICSLIFDVNFQ